MLRFIGDAVLAIFPVSKGGATAAEACAKAEAAVEDAVARKDGLNLKRQGFGFPPLGHGIGLHLHEEPYLGKYDDYELEAGMVLGIEPLVYETGFGFGLQLKDMVAVTETGAELLSDVTDTDKLFPIT